jgi:hypothetical protein
MRDKRNAEQSLVGRSEGRKGKKMQNEGSPLE